MYDRFVTAIRKRSPSGSSFHLLSHPRGVSLLAVVSTLKMNPPWEAQVELVDMGSAFFFFQKSFQNSSCQKLRRAKEEGVVEMAMRRRWDTLFFFFEQTCIARRAPGVDPKGL
jgi:hypothetical protein